MIGALLESVVSFKGNQLRVPRPRGRALGRARLLLEPLVAYRLLAEPRVLPLVLPRAVPRAVPRVEYLEVGLEEIVLGGCSTKDVSVVLGEIN